MCVCVQVGICKNTTQFQIPGFTNLSLCTSPFIIDIPITCVSFDCCVFDKLASESVVKFGTDNSSQFENVLLTLHSFGWICELLSHAFRLHSECSCVQTQVDMGGWKRGRV